MIELPPQNGLAQAAEALGVAKLASEDLRTDDTLHQLRLAAAVLGAADAFAMVHASAMANRAGEDPIRTIETVAFQAAGMRGRNPRETGAFWSIWGLRRLQQRIAAMLEEEADDELAAVSALLDAAHALLSGFVHRTNEDSELHEACVERARIESRAALQLLSNTWQR
jgi:hypothetical protein